MVLIEEIPPHLKAISFLPIAQLHSATVEAVGELFDKEGIQYLGYLPASVPLLALSQEPFPADRRVERLKTFQQVAPLVVSPAEVVEDVVAPHLVFPDLAAELLEAVVLLAVDLKCRALGLSQRGAS